MIAYACNPEGGGEHWLGWGWAAEAARQFTVHLVTTPNHQAQVQAHAESLGITPHFVAVPTPAVIGSRLFGATGNWWRKIAWQRRVVQVARELHAREPFQLVHQTTFHTFRVPFLATRLNIPAVWGPIAGGESVPPGFARDLGAARWGERWRAWGNRLWLFHPAVRESLRRSDVLFVSNRTTRAFLPPSVHPKCVVVPPNALRAEQENPPPPPPRAAPTRASEDVFRLLYVGNCVATRALPLVFAALRHPAFETYRLTVVGGGPALRCWQRRVDRWGLSARVQFTGPVPRERLAALYQGADAFVFPALRDSGGSGLLEAMSFGLPVICLDWGGPGEMVDAGSGVKISVRNRAETVAALAAAFSRLKDLPELRRLLGQAGQKRVREHFRWDAKRALLESTYQQLLSRR